MRNLTFTINIYFLGQVVSAEILYATEHGCPIELHKIPIDKCDDMYDEECTGEAFMPFHRALYDRRTGQSPNNPREQVKKSDPFHTKKSHQSKKQTFSLFQLNRMTSWIDGSFVYSTKEAWLNAMRTFVNGTFKMRGDPILGMPPLNTQRIPLFNQPAPNILKMQSPERLYRKLIHQTELSCKCGRPDCVAGIPKMDDDLAICTCNNRFWSEMESHYFLFLSLVR